jgi:hypothetical protein
MLHAYFTPIALCFIYTLWHFYAFSETNLLTRCHSVSFLFSAVFVFQKSYARNILGIGRNEARSSYFPDTRQSPKHRRRGVIRPKRIYFPDHFCYCFSFNLCVLNTTNTDWRCFQQNCSGVLFLCRNPTFSKNSRKIIKNPISPEDPQSQKTRRRGGSRAPLWRPTFGLRRNTCVMCYSLDQW